VIDPFTYFWILLKASLFSTGGTGNLPSIHADLVAHGWATDRHFSEALAMGQISPGPTGLWVISLGYLTYGVPGALMASLALCIPPMLVLLVAALHRRVGDHPAMQGFVRGLGLAVSGIFLVVVAKLMQENGIDVVSVSIMLVSVGIAITGRVPVPVLLILAGVAGALLY
jgi:chromate transporter